MKFDFECLDGRWYVVYPEYEGPFEDLEMVENADKMLEALTTDNLCVSLNIDTEEPVSGDCFRLEMEGHDDFGAHYDVVDCDKFQGTVWLCNVVHHLFGEHPERFYCSVAD